MHVAHSWLRLLVSYHSPTLCQHLDKAVPGWELPLSNASTAATTAASSVADEKKANHSDKSATPPPSGTDELRRELGLTDDPTPTQSLSDKQNATEPTGCIPLKFLQGIFTGTVPSQQACIILDWAVLNYERYSGKLHPLHTCKTHFQRN